MPLNQNDVILFIGDSITDDQRRNDPDGLGQGYVRYVHDYFLIQHPEKNFRIINKGISGNRVIDLRDRWQQDVIQQNPDWVSISIGINDVWRQLDRPSIKQVYSDEFYTVYKNLLQSVKEQTNANLIIMEPTIIEEDINSKGNRMLKEYVSITKELSSDFNAIHIPMHTQFIEYLSMQPNHRLTVDGVHMNSLGKMLMAITWLETMGLIKK